MKQPKTEPSFSLWPTSIDGRKLAVSQSRTEPQPVIGYVTKNQDGTWSIERDGTTRRFQGAEAAGKTLIAEATARHKPPPEKKED
jgi:hypothetical protein